MNYSSDRRNYANLVEKVVIPNGATVTNCNFSQATERAGEDAITGTGITFVDCNMTKLRPHASWILTNCQCVNFSTDGDGNNTEIPWTV
jgi:hypothetical protein